MIRWFRKNTTGALEDLGLGDPVIQQGRNWTTQYHNTEFLNQPYSPSLLGKYWCQVINTTADPDQPLMRSNVFTLLAPGNYSGPTCSGVQIEQVLINLLMQLHQVRTCITQYCYTLNVLNTRTNATATIASFTDITSHTAIISISQSLTYMLSVVTTPKPTRPTPPTTLQSPFILVIVVVGVAIVIVGVIAVVAVTAVVVLFIIWRQSTDSSRG